MELSGFEITNHYETRTNDYNLRLEITGYGSTMEAAARDLEQKLDAFEGKAKTRVKLPATGVKPRKLPF